MRSGASRRLAAATVVVVLAIVALSWWWFDRRTRPDAVGPRFTEALLQRRPGTTVDAWSAGVMRVALASGVYIDVRLSTLFDACRADRFDCSSAIGRALDDVDHAAAATRDPTRATLRPVVVDEPARGFVLGYVAEPLVGRLELRYALVDGSASTFVTSAIADRLGLSPAALKAAALEAQRAEPPAALEALVPDGPVFRVRSAGDPAASLIDRDRMTAFATRLAVTRLLAAVPASGSLYLARADDAGRKALTEAVGGTKAIGGVDVLAYDVDAPDGAALAIATRTR